MATIVLFVLIVSSFIYDAKKNEDTPSPIKVEVKETEENQEITYKIIIPKRWRASNIDETSKKIEPAYSK